MLLCVRSTSALANVDSVSGKIRVVEDQAAIVDCDQLASCILMVMVSHSSFLFGFDVSSITEVWC